jgi:Zn-dependent protease with chaperone function/Tfp pilus assembly protein PilE
VKLHYKHEKPLFLIAATISAFVFLPIILGSLGLYLLIGYVVFLFVHSVFISHLKGSGVRISETQYPDLYDKVVKGCNKFAIAEIPEAYLLRTGFFNALATRFLSRHFLVLYTDVVDALEEQPGALDFYIGHELGHIHRKHLKWGWFLFPASFVPLLGAALRRAEEYTCDRYGAACCETEDDIKAAIAALAAGDSRWKSMNYDSYLEQIQCTSGFWMSFNELTSDYPWLTKRMASAIAFKRGENIKHPRRHGFAWFLACFAPRVGTSGLSSMFVIVALVGILAAIAVPAYKDYTDRNKMSLVYSSAQDVKAKVETFVVNNQQWPASMKSLGYNSETVKDSKSSASFSLYGEGMVIANVDKESYLVLEPSVSQGNLIWKCFGENIPKKILPDACK